MSSVPPAKFFVNRGIVSSRTDLLNVLRPLEKQTVAYRYYRGHELVQHGMGWVERIVANDPETSTFFTPLSICLNVDSFEHLEFETRPDQLLSYRLVQGDEAVLIDFAPAGVACRRRARAPSARVRYVRLRPDGVARPRCERGRVGDPDTARPRSKEEAETDPSWGVVGPRACAARRAAPPGKVELRVVSRSVRQDQADTRRRHRWTP